MKVVAINGSPNREGNTYHLIKMVADELKNENIDVEIIHIGDKLIRGCMACYQCAKNRDERCVIDDEANLWIQKMKEADGILLASPTYYSSIAGTMKSFLDRAFYVSAVNRGLFRHKVGASVVADRRAGGIPVFDQLNNYMLYSEMVLASSNYWNVAYGMMPGEVEADQEGRQIMSILAKNMGWLLKVIESSKEAIDKPKQEKKIFTNFIR